MLTYGLEKTHRSSVRPDVSEQGHSPSVLLMPEGSVLAHVGRCLALADRLDHLGAAVSFAASGTHARRVQDAGYPVEPVATIPREALLARLRKGGSAFDERTLVEYIEDEIRLLREIRPDVVVGDFRPSLGISAVSESVPYVCIVNAVWTRYYGVRLEPPETWLPVRVLGKRILKALQPLAEPHVFAFYARPFDKVRRRYGLDPLRDIRECMCSPGLNILPDSEELFPCRSLPDDYRYTGPILWEPEVPDPPWMNRLDSSAETAYLTMGSTGPIEQISRIAAQLLDQGMQVICTTSTGSPEMWPDRDRFFGIRYAPGGKLCERADVVVCHAGNGTIYQALSRGTPLVGIPEFHDQEFNMQRIEELGLGLRARMGRRLAEEVVACVERVRSEESFSERAGRFRALRDTDGATNGAQEILRFAGETGDGMRTRREREQ